MPLPQEGTLGPVRERPLFCGQRGTITNCKPENGGIRSQAVTGDSVEAGDERDWTERERAQSSRNVAQGFPCVTSSS